MTDQDEIKLPPLPTRTLTVHSDADLIRYARKAVRVPIIEPLRIAHCWEHTPLDYYRYGEYPRFLRPVGAHEPRSKWQIIDALDGGQQ